jgi:hypothetical protein
VKAWPLVLLLIAAPAMARDSLGVFEDWAAFRDPARGNAPLRCYAIAEPERANAPGFYATVGHWPASRVRSQFYIRLPRTAAGAATLTIASRRFALTARGAGLWAADARTDAAIVAAMRSAGSMSVSAGGMSASWRLRGAATAIDAAALGCARR